MLAGKVAAATLLIMGLAVAPALADVTAGTPSNNPSLASAGAAQGAPVLDLAATAPPAAVSRCDPPAAPSPRRLLPWFWVTVGGLVLISIIAAVIASDAPQPRPGNFGTFTFP